MTELCISRCDVLPHLTAAFGTWCDASCLCRYGNRFLNSVDELLCDSAGVELFNRFLSSKFCLGHLLDFWFACKGFRCSENLDTPDKLFQVAKVIYRAYIKSGALFEVPLPERVRAEIITRMALYHTGYKVRYTVSLGPINRSLYDSAGEYVKTTLEQVYYPAFQKFITDAHFLLGCPKEDSSSPDLSRAPSTYASSAPHVPANFSADIQAPIRELKAEVNPLRHCFTDCSTAADGHGISDQSSSSGITTSCFPTAPPGPCCFSRVPPTLEDKPIRSSPIDEVVTPLNNPQSSDPYTARDRNCHLQTPAFITDSLLDSTTAPYSPPHVDSSCPAVAVNHDTNSCADKPLDQFSPTTRKMTTTVHASTEHATRPRSRYGPEKASLITHQDAACLQNTVDIIKRGQNIAETDPTSFVLLLTAKLENVKKSRGRIAKLLSWVGQLDEGFLCTEQVNTSEPNTELPKCRSRTGILSPSNGKQDLEPQLNDPPRLSSTQPVFCDPSFDFTCQISHDRSMRSERTRNALATAVATDEDAQGILDYHCSRIWADEHGHGCANSDGSRVSRLQHIPNLEVASHIPNVGVNSTDVRRSAAQCSGSDSVARYHMTASSVPPLHSHRGFGRVQVAHRKRTSTRGNRQRTPPSDEKSTTSWDSGVVDTCALVDMYPEHMAHCSELETNSIVAAASLQALSSSNTELATLNSEVTEKLLKRMSRHPLQKQAQQDRSKLFISAYGTESFAPNGVTLKDAFHSSHLSASRLGCKSMTHSADSRFSSDMTHTGPRNPISPHAEPLHCPRHTATRPNQLISRLASETYGVPAQLTYRLGPGRYNSFRPASDSSSAFDSGVSSTYDHLPCGTTQLTIQKDHSRVHRTRQPLSPTSKHPSFPPLSSVTVPSFHPYGTLQSNEMDAITGCCPVSYRNADTMHCVSQSSDLKFSPAHLRPTRPVGEGHLLQRWLRWQSSSEDIRSSALKSKRCQPTEHKTHRHHHHHSRPTMLNLIQSVNSGNTECIDLTNNRKSGQNTCCLIGPADSPSSGAAGLIVGYYLCDDPVPYRTVWLGSSTACGRCAAPHPSDNSSRQKSLTLGDFKQLIAKKGVYRYFFKKESDEFGSGVVHEEIVHDDSILPLWDGKVIARVERAD